MNKKVTASIFLAQLFILLNLFSNLAQAEGKQVLFFINLNYSTQEYAQAQKIAARSQQVLEMVPPLELMNHAQELQYKRVKLLRIIDSILPGIGEVRRNNILASDDNITDNLRNRLGQDLIEYRSMRKQLESYEKKNYSSIVEQIITKTNLIKSRGDHIDRVVVSSHSEGAILFGETSMTINYTDFPKIYSESPSFFTDPRQVILLACFTGTKMFLQQYRNYFQNASMIAGFYARSPSRYNPTAIDIFDQLIRAGDELDNQPIHHDPLTIEMAFRNKPLFTAKHAAADYRGHLVTSAPNLEPCEEQWLTFISWSSQLRALYFAASDSSAVPLFEPPMDSPNSELLKFYSKVQQLCPITDAKQGEFYDITPAEEKEYEETRREWIDMGVRLRFWPQVQSNFTLYFQNDLRELQKIMRDLGFKTELPTFSGHTGRIELGRAYDAIIKESKRIISPIVEYNLTKYPAVVKSEEEARKIENYSKQMDALFERYQVFLKKFEIIRNLVQLNSKIPINWIENGAVASSRN